MKKVNVKNLVFWGLFTLMLIVTIAIYIDGTANAVKEPVMEIEERVNTYEVFIKEQFADDIWENIAESAVENGVNYEDIQVEIDYDEILHRMGFHGVDTDGRWFCSIYPANGDLFD